jgi:proteasome lid subunit RPN8/RPN11
LAEGEISWIGEIRVVDNQIQVVDLTLIEQDTTPTRTKWNDDAYAEFVLKYVEAGKDPADLKLWYHSHGNCGVSWSDKDEKTIETHERAEYFLSIVTNKAGDILARVDYFRPLRLTFHNVKVVVVPEYPQEMIKKEKAEVESLVHFTKDEPEVSEFYYPYPTGRRIIYAVGKARRHTAPTGD